MQPWNGQVRKKVEVHPSNPKHILYSEREFLQSGISHTTEHRLLGILQVFITHVPTQTHTVQTYMYIDYTYPVYANRNFLYRKR